MAFRNLDALAAGEEAGTRVRAGFLLHDATPSRSHVVLRNRRGPDLEG